MKHIVTLFCGLFLPIFLFGQKMSYGDMFRDNAHRIEFTANFGTSYNVKGCMFGFDMSIGGFLFGTNFAFDVGNGSSTYVPSSKTVHVDGYYKSNGTYVDSYNRAAPGKGGGSYVLSSYSKVDEYYIGYWLPLYKHKSNSHSSIDFCSTPILGISKGEVKENSFWTKSNRPMFGAGIKIAWIGFGVSMRVTNTSLMFGVSAIIGKVY